MFGRARRTDDCTIDRSAIIFYIPHLVIGHCFRDKRRRRIRVRVVSNTRVFRHHDPLRGALETPPPYYTRICTVVSSVRSFHRSFGRENAFTINHLLLFHVPRTFVSPYPCRVGISRVSNFPRLWIRFSRCSRIAVIIICTETHHKS